MSNAYFYNSQDDDRLYDADSFSEWLKKFFTNGVFNGELQVKAINGMNVEVTSGYACYGGKTKLFEQTSLGVAVADSTFDRVDTVVVERNDLERDFILKIVKGNPTTSPKAIAPIRDSENGIYQLVLAEIYMKAGATSVTQADITDKRMYADVCGYVASTVDEIDFSQIAAQFHSWQEQFTEQKKNDFEEWFTSLETFLEGDVAANLQGQISELKRMATAFASEINEKVYGEKKHANLITSNWANGMYSFNEEYPSDVYDLQIELDGDNATKEIAEAWGKAMIVGKFSNELKALGEVPTVPIPVILKVTKR